MTSKKLTKWKNANCADSVLDLTKEYIPKQNLES